MLKLAPFNIQDEETQVAQARKYDSRVAAILMQVAPGRYALFDNGRQLLAIGNWQQLEKQYLSRPKYVPKPRTQSKKKSKAANTAALLAKLGDPS